jgi:hypothetical protein
MGFAIISLLFLLGGTPASGSTNNRPPIQQTAETRATWEAEVKQMNRNVGALEQFFEDIREARDAAQRRAAPTRGVQGAWSVLAALIEKHFGRTAR